MSSKRRTDLKPSKAKNLEELDFDVRKSLAPRKSSENNEKPKKNKNKKPDLFLKKIFRRQKIEICKSSETRVAEVSRRSEPSSGGKRTFEVRRRRRSSAVRRKVLGGTVKFGFLVLDYHGDNAWNILCVDGWFVAPSLY